MIEIANIMSTDLVTVGPADNLEKASEIMRSKRIHHLPVVEDDGGLAGLLTLTDVLAATDSKLRTEDDKIAPGFIMVSDVMTKDVATVDEQAGLRDAALFLEKHRIGCLPVVSEGQLRGIITDTDFVAVAINLLEQIEETDFDDDV